MESTLASVLLVAGFGSYISGIVYLVTHPTCGYTYDKAYQKHLSVNDKYRTHLPLF